MRIEELERLAAAHRAGQGRRHDTSRDYRGNVTFHRPPTPQERIYNTILASGRAVTRGEIARLLGLRKTPWLTAQIEGLVADSYVLRTHGTWKNGTVMYLYEVKQ